MFTHGAERAPIPVSGYRQEDQSITLDLKIAYADAPVPGSLVRVDCTGSEQLWLTVEGVRFRHNEGSPLEDTVEITGQGLWLLRQPPTPSSLPDVEKLSFTLLAQRGNGYPVSLADLTFSVDHPRFWKALPTDEQLYREAEVTSDPEHSALWKAVAHTPYADLWIASANPRFPLAGDDAPGEIYIPLVLPATLGANPTPTYFVPYDKGVGKRLDALVRDGLQAFNASLFLDQDMVDALVPDLITQADFLRDQRVETRPIPTLRGIYTALSIEEASIIAIPDAYQRGWRLAQPDDPPSPEPSQRSHPEWWHCPADVVPGDIHTVIAEQHGKFHNAEMRVIEQPVLRLEDEPDHAGTFTLAWLSVDQDARSILEEALHSDYRDATEIYNGSEQHFTLYGRGQGYYYYRVRIEVAGAASDWSDGLVVSVAPTGRWRLNTEAEYEAHDLLAIQRALIRMCSARGDLFAVLTLPDHFHEDKAIAYIATLKALPAQIVQAGNEAGQSTGSAQGTTPPTPSSPDKRDAAYNVFPLRYDERSAFSYAALYYPWPIIRDGQQAEGRVLAAPSLKRIPPDGIICGIMAKRALIRGAWIAPANELFIDVVALTTGTGLNWQRWQTAQVNLLHQERRGFLSLNADTLCDDEDADLRPINVRRLLILLRRMALRLGATYVFELDNNSFRRLVQREFEAMMEQMFKRGAFAGNTPDTSFQVVVGQGRGVDLGRFIVELRVAPSLPLTFLTLRLVQSGTTGSVTEVL